MSKVIITAAITGAIHTPTMTPYLPITPAQIADEAYRAYNAGAAVAHIHVRDPETGQPSSRLELFREVATKVKSRCNIVLCFTTGGGLTMSTRERVAVVPELQPELASFNTGSLNFGLFHLVSRYEKFKYEWEKNYLQMTEDYIFPNTFKTMREFCAVMKEYGTKPELEVYDSGMINNIAYLVNAGILTKPLYIQFVLGILGGIPATVRSLSFLYESTKEALGDNFAWSVCAAGRTQLAMGATALAMGGNVRVGLEDSLYAGKGQLAKSNAEQVEKVVQIAKALSIEPATPDEARQILGLKGLDKVNY